MMLQLCLSLTCHVHRRPLVYRCLVSLVEKLLTLGGREAGRLSFTSPARSSRKHLKASGFRICELSVSCGESRKHYGSRKRMEVAAF